jgi:ribosomal protein S18 acetylase RimI-like enzyme
MTDQFIVRPAREDEIPAVGYLIADSFNDLLADAYLVPPLEDRLTVMADCAVWFDYTREAPDPENYEERLAKLAGKYLDRFQALDELFAEHHPHDEHWHLAFLAVHPEEQAHGLGSKLMERTHEELDKAGTPAYLEATNANNVRLYRRHGYVDMNPFEMLLPDGTPFFRMWRKPA